MASAPPAPFGATEQPLLLESLPEPPVPLLVELPVPVLVPVVAAWVELPVPVVAVVVPVVVPLPLPTVVPGTSALALTLARRVTDETAKAAIHWSSFIQDSVAKVI